MNGYSLSSEDTWVQLYATATIQAHNLRSGQSANAVSKTAREKDLRVPLITQLTKKTPQYLPPPMDIHRLPYPSPQKHCYRHQAFSRQQSNSIQDLHPYIAIASRRWKQCHSHHSLGIRSSTRQCSPLFTVFASR